MSQVMDRQELRKGILIGMKRGGSLIAASMTPQERSLRSKKAAATRWRGHTPQFVQQRLDAKQLARTIRHRAETAEPSVTPDIASVVEESGGRMEGLEYRLKTVRSMARKIRTKAHERGQTLSESASRISDSLRYTGVIGEPPPGAYVGAIKKIIESLQDKGMEVLELETHWMKGDAYNGIHLIVQHPNGTKVEIQFHTPESLSAKYKTHVIYEKARKKGVSPAKRARMVREMIEIADRAPTPEGAMSIGKPIFRPPTD